jgi:hypothetical protein
MFQFYLSESGFSTMELLKSKYRSSLSDEHLNDCMRVTITKHTLDYNEEEEGMLSHVLHYP